MSLALCAATSGAHASGGVEMEESQARRLYELEADLAKARLACSEGPKGKRRGCLEQAQGRFEIGKAWLEQEESPSAEGRYRLAMVKARADHEAAERGCSSQKPPEQVACLRQAQDRREAAEKMAKERRERERRGPGPEGSP